MSNYFVHQKQYIEYEENSLLSEYIYTTLNILNWQRIIQNKAYDVPFPFFPLPAPN